MSYCINPKCPRPQNPENVSFCQSCGSQLVIEGRYWVLRPLGKGGFGQTYEVNEGSIPKVLKLLTYNEPTGVRLFQQEAHVLMRLRHPGLPIVDPDGYFTFTPNNSREPLHCLVMEKIEGVNLQQWLENRSHQPLAMDLAIDWLEQLARILHLVHSQNYFHRDIKPPNIMLRPNGQLVLIDFGAVREVTETIERRSNKITRIFSRGYTPLEQMEGAAEPRSDFFALGRSFACLLTGQEPSNLEENSPPGKFIWRTLAPGVSKPLADLIDDMMAYSVNARPQDTQFLLQRIAKLREPPRTPTKFPVGKKQVLIGVGVATAIALAAIVPKILPQPTPEKLLLYQNTENNFRMKYPEKWEMKESQGYFDPNIVTFRAPKKNDSDIYPEDIIVTIDDLSSKPMSLDEYTKISITQIKEIKDTKVLEDSSAMLANTKAHKVIFTTREEDKNIKKMQVWTVKNNRAYTITYTANKDEYSNYLKSAETVINSLEIN
ncbi:serine/threonine-protein kinase [Kamptonema sp. UHCC 0994]|uniref:serine/threonine-protein kinase n=1 Tax=Kamptonema sp. UHCC 0994 TaxID=3031329 RepID=UPI0023B96DDF|nr:serine/threonine-protein kinase [Kamptonema sp. UHCC 0994]MDF0552442.1 protein kinase [Kamptonema sp. UHCC 0994]